MVDLLGTIVKPVGREIERRTAEGVGGDEVRTGLDIQGRHLGQDLWAREVERLRTVSRLETARHQLGAPRAVTAQRLAGTQSFEHRPHLIRR